MGGGPRFLRFGRKILYREHELNAWAEQRSFQASTPPHSTSQSEPRLSVRVERTDEHEISDALLLVAHVADSLAVSPRSVRRWIATGELLAHRFGRQVRISESELRATNFCARAGRKSFCGTMPTYVCSAFALRCCLTCPRPRNWQSEWDSTHGANNRTTAFETAYQMLIGNRSTDYTRGFHSGSPSGRHGNINGEFSQLFPGTKASLVP
jgi:excisionase family DNA binding protein